MKYLLKSLAMKIVDPNNRYIVEIIIAVVFVALVIYLKSDYLFPVRNSTPQKRQAQWRKRSVKMTIFFLICLTFLFFRLVQQKHGSLIPPILLLIAASVHCYINIYCTFFCNSCGKQFRVIALRHEKIICPYCGFSEIRKKHLHS